MQPWRQRHRRLYVDGGRIVASKHRNVYCVIGDLSFFYDRNALWNSRLRGNLRILLLNNGGGAIFEKFSRLTDDNDIRNVKATYRTSARGVCSDNGADYRVAADREQLSDGLRWLTNDVSDRQGSWRWRQTRQQTGRVISNA